jgi:hypothetical protein
MVDAEAVPPAGFGRVIATALITAVLYAGLSSSSVGTCSGDSTHSQPTCLSVTFQPQPLVFLLLAAICVAAIVIGGRAASEAAACRVQLRAIVALVAVGVVGALVTSPIFYSAEMTQWHGGAPPQFWFSPITSISPTNSG